MITQGSKEQVNTIVHEAPARDKLAFIILATVILTALVTGLAVYAWQQQKLEVMEEDMMDQLVNMETDLGVEKFDTAIPSTADERHISETFGLSFQVPAGMIVEANDVRIALWEDESFDRYRANVAACDDIDPATPCAPAYPTDITITEGAVDFAIASDSVVKLNGLTWRRIVPLGSVAPTIVFSGTHNGRSYLVAAAETLESQTVELLNTLELLTHSTSAMSVTWSDWKTYSDEKNGYKISHPASVKIFHSAISASGQRATNEACTKLVFGKHDTPSGSFFLEGGFILINPTSVDSTCSADYWVNQDQEIRKTVTVEGKSYNVVGKRYRNVNDPTVDVFQFTIGANTISFGVETNGYTSLTSTALEPWMEEQMAEVVSSLETFRIL